MKKILNLIIAASFFLNIGSLIADDFENFPLDREYYIQSVQGTAGKGFWSQGGNRDIYKPGDNLQTSELDSSKSKKFGFFSSGDGWYYIRSSNLGYVDVSGSKNNNGNNVLIWDGHGMNNQKFRFKNMGGGRWKIFTYDGKVLCTPREYNENGSNIHIWEDHDGDWMEWYFIDAISCEKVKIPKPITPVKKAPDESSNPPSGYYYIKSVQSGGENAGYWDQPGRTEIVNDGANLSVWAWDDVFNEDQKFLIYPNKDGWYNIIPGNGGFLSVDSNNNSNGSNVYFKRKNNNDNGAKFWFKHLGDGRWKIYTYWNKAICTPRNYSNGSNIHLWDDHDGDWMEWYLLDEKNHKRAEAKNGPFRIISKHNRVPTDKFFYIKSAQAGLNEDAGYWDQPGRPRQYNPGIDIGLYGKDSNFSDDQMFRFIDAEDGWYYIESKNGGRIETKDGKNANEVRIGIQSPASVGRQKFWISYNGEGRWEISTYWNKVICTPRRYSNGTYIHTWENHQGLWMEWYLVDSNTGKSFELPLINLLN